MAENALLVCLANSYRPGGHCVAGKRMTGDGFGGWIRPISHRPTAELTNAECQYPGHVMPALLDLILVGLDYPYPSGHQTENVLIRNHPWVK